MDDLISRQAAIDAIKHHGEIENDYTDIYHDGYCDGIFDAVDTLVDLPSAQPELIEQAAYIRGFDQGRTQGMIDTQREPMSRLIDNTIKAEWTNADALNLQPTCNQLATDCISRQVAIDGKISIQRADGVEIYSDEAVPIEYLKRMPPIEPERKKGKWLERSVDIDGKKSIEEWQSAKCSVCGRYHTTPYLYYFDDYNFCPNCGAKMEREQKHLGNKSDSVFLDEVTYDPEREGGE